MPLVAETQAAADLAALKESLVAFRPARAPFIVGVTGAVAVGKSAIADALAADPRPWPPDGAPANVARVNTDGYLFANAVLEARGLAMRKGFPETYDLAALAEDLQAVRAGPVTFRGYSHGIYDVDPACDVRIARPAILIVEGLGLGASALRDRLDALVYLDAAETDVEAWFVCRFLRFWAAARTDPASFYRRFADLDEAGAEGVARMVWREINLPNLRENIAPVRAIADIVVTKAADHRIVDVEARSLRCPVTP